MASLGPQRLIDNAASRPAFAVGLAYEAGLDAAARKRGAHFTPCDVALALAARVLDAWRGDGTPMVCDPSCGGGVFLVAMADALAARGIEPRHIVEELLIGVDLDPGAVAASREALRCWGLEHAVSVTPRMRCADGLAVSPDLDGRVDIVIGNPPFQSQMARVNARSTEARAEATARFGAAAGGYADTASLFVLRSLEMVGAAGIVALVLPRSLLATRDGTQMRREVMGRGRVVECWIPDERVFAASVDVVMPVVAAGSMTESTSGVTAPPTLLRGGRLGERPLGEVRLDGESWSALHATAQGVPNVESPDDSSSQDQPVVIGDAAYSTAGFRDQYYGLIGHVTDSPPSGRGARLVTTAMIDVGRCEWGERGVRFAKQRWDSPWVDLDAVGLENLTLLDWIDRLLVPKVLVATQTRVIEAVADPHGLYVPSTPVIAVVPTALHSADAIAAALLAPPASAWAHQRFGGAALSSSALKLAARQVTQIPLPTDREPWMTATELLAGADATGDPDWVRIGRLLCDSWRVDSARLLGWWLDLVVR